MYERGLETNYFRCEIARYYRRGDWGYRKVLYPELNCCKII